MIYRANGTFNHANVPEPPFSDLSRVLCLDITQSPQVKSQNLLHAFPFVDRFCIIPASNNHVATLLYTLVILLITSQTMAQEPKCLEVSEADALIE